MSSLKESIQRSLAIQEGQKRLSDEKVLQEDAFHKMLVGKGFKRKGSEKGSGFDVSHHYQHPDTGMTVKLNSIGARSAAHALKNHGRTDFSFKDSPSVSLSWPGGWSQSYSVDHPDDLAKHIDQKSSEMARDSKKLRFKPKS